MVNAWSLAASILDGTFDKDYPIMTEKTGNININTGVGNTVTYNVPLTDTNLDGDITISTGSTATEPAHSPYYYDYNRNDPDRENPFTDAFDYMMGEAVVGGGNTASLDNSNSYCLDDGYPPAFTTLSDNDDQVAHLFADSLTLNIEGPTEDNMTDSRNKYHENEILEDIKAYVSGTYNGHYTGNKHEFRNVQTIDLMASRDLASDFCQANILKYGSRYGSKDGRNKKDLLKVIHYAMLLLHFDEHYGKPSMTSGNIDHNMP